MQQHGLNIEHRTEAPHFEVGRSVAGEVRRRVRGGAVRRGFTLLEVLVAMSILIVIALMMSTLFGQSRTAWERGTRKTELAMEARAALNLISREIAQAVADETLDDGSMGSGTMISFYSMGDLSASNRLLRFITYVGGSGTALKRKVQELKTVNGYPVPDPDSVEEGDLLTLPDKGQLNVEFEAGPLNSSAYATLTNLPEWVDIRIELQKSSDFSGASVRSAGPNKKLNDGDDVTSGVK